MKWSRKTKEFDYADYISEDGKYRISDLSIHHKEWWNKNGKNGYWWGLIDNDTNEILKGNFKTVKQTKEYVSNILS